MSQIQKLKALPLLTTPVILTSYQILIQQMFPMIQLKIILDWTERFQHILRQQNPLFQQITPTMHAQSSLSSSPSYLSILERKKTLEQAALQVKLAEDQEKRKLELHEKSFLYQKQKIENEALIAKEKVALVNFEQNL